jgi:hypothetical protein
VEKDRAGRVLAFLGPAMLIVGCWLAWKLWYFGDVLPNTYYLKGASASVRKLEFGIMYVLAFFWYYLLFPAAILWLLRWRSWMRETPSLLLFASSTLWLLYVVRVGGDFMEFRFIVPAIPLLMISVAQVMQWNRGKPAVAVALLLLYLAGNFYAARADLFGRYGLETIRQLQGHVTDQDQNWKGIGIRLNELFTENADVTIATSAAGAIPFYSRLRTIDLLGLNDAWVARNGTERFGKPGHERVASLAYVIAQGTNILVGHPNTIALADTTYGQEEVFPKVLLRGMMGTELPRDCSIIEIPINERQKLLALYLVPHHAVERAVASGGIKAIPLMTFLK